MSTTGLMVGVGTFVALGAAAVVVWEFLLAPAHEEGAPATLVPRREPPSALTEAVGALARPEDPHERERLTHQLAQAGWQSPGALSWFFAIRTVATVGLPLAVWFGSAELSTVWRALLVLLSAALAFYGPVLIVAARRHARQRRLRRAITDMLDMLISCLESGLGIDAALRYVASEIGIASPELAHELQVTNAELAAGMPRLEALHRLDLRTGIEELGALTTVLGQAERFGAGVAPSIRAHAHLARRRRTLDAEQRAARASPILTVVMILFILPALFVVLLGPTVILVTEQL
jgi:tight adherence protein C